MRLFYWRNEIGNPQHEDGHVKIANKIVEALVGTSLSGREWQCLWVIFRQTYGWNKKEDWISGSQFEKWTGIAQCNAFKVLKRLERRNMILVNRESPTEPKYGFNKFYDEWKQLPKVTVLSKKIAGTVKIDRNVLSDSTDTKDNTTKDILQKTDITALREIFDYWNSLGIIKHKVVDKFKVHLIAALNHYTADELKGAMENHKKIIESKDHFWTHKFGLAQFLTQKNGLDTFLTENKPFENWRIDGKGRGKTGRSQPESITKAKKRSEQEGGKYPSGHKVEF